METEQQVIAYPFLQGGGEMGELTRTFNWEQTSVGTPDQWPQSLRTTVSNLLRSKFPMFLWWGEDMIQFYNDAYRPSMGNEGKHPSALGAKGPDTWPEIWPIISPLMRQVQTTGEATWMENQLVPIFRNGKIEDVYWTYSYSSVLDDDGNHGGILVTCMETTDAVKAHNQVEESEARFRNAIEQAPVAIGLTSGEDFIFESINAPMLQIINKKDRHEVIGKPLSEVLPELVSQPVFDILLHVLQTGEMFQGIEVEAELVIDGVLQPRYYNITYSRVIDKKKIPSVLHMCVDVTEQVLARRKTQESETKYRSLFESIDQGYCTLEVIFEGNKCVDYRYLETNPGFERHLGMSNALGKTIREIAPDIEPKWFDFYGSVALTGIPIRIEEESKAFNKWFEVYATRVGRPEERKIGVFFTDTTERKKAEEAIRQSESNLRNTILQAPVAMAILKGPRFIIDIANDAMYELWGRSKEELQNRSIFEGLPEVKDQGYEELLTGVFTTGERFSAQSIPVTLPRNGDIETVYINLLYEALREADGTIAGVIAVAVDVTQQVVARMKIEESNNDFRFVTDFMPQMIWVTRPDGYHYYYNKQWYDYTGLTYGETEGEGWNNVFHPDDQERAWKHWRHSLATGEPYQIEYRCRRYDGAYRWVLGRALPLRDEAGAILKWFGTCTDIHDQKVEAQLLEQKVEERTAELQVAIQELKRSNANLEEFAHAASHDLKEPVRKIHFFSNQLKEQLSGQLDQGQTRALNRIENATERMGNLIDDLLLYSQVSQRPHDTESIDLNQKVQRVLEDLELDIAEKDATIKVEKLPIIRGYRRQLQQLFQNLISNAIKYSKADVPPLVEIRAEEVEKGGKRYYLIKVRDNGIGFEEEYKDKIFQMFARLHGKAEYTGTGVGLSIVKKVVENHKGFIEVESEPGKGSTFGISFPVEKE